MSRHQRNDFYDFHSFPIFFHIYTHVKTPAIRPTSAPDILSPVSM
jgi:hypothetical protein